MVQSSVAPMAYAPTLHRSSSNNNINNQHHSNASGLAFSVGPTGVTAAAPLPGAHSGIHSSISFSNQHNNNSLSGSKYMDDPSFYGSVLDQLHAEQKSTIEALSQQVEFYRQREERYRKEVDSLRKYVARSNSAHNNAHNSSSASVHASAADADAQAKAQAFADVVAENRALGDEVDAWRSRKAAWEQDKQRLERAQLETESQLRDARHSLASLSHAIEQLELKTQRRDAEEQTRALALEQQLRSKTLECEQLQDAASDAQQTLAALEAAQRDNTQLRTDLAASRAAAASAATDASSALHAQLEAAQRDHERVTTQLQQQLSDAKRNAVDKQQLLDAATTNDASTRQAHERELTELRSRMAAVQRDLTDTQSQLADAQTQLHATTSRLVASDRSVLVTTLRSEITFLKERLRTEFEAEKTALERAHSALATQNTALAHELEEATSARQRIERELRLRDETLRQTTVDVATLREQKHAADAACVALRRQYEQLQSCQTSIAAQLDTGFKELLLDDASAARALAQRDQLQQEVAAATTRIATLECEKTAATDALERIRRDTMYSTKQLHDQLDALRIALTDKERVMATLQQERFAVERTTDTLKDRNAALVSELSALQTDVMQLRSDLAVCQQQLQSATLERDQRDADLAQAQADVTRLNATVAGLELRLSETTEALETSRLQHSKREQKLRNDRKRLERDVNDLVVRITTANDRNVALGDKIVGFAKQSKTDQTNVVALHAQVRTYRQRTRRLEQQLAAQTITASDENATRMNGSATTIAALEQQVETLHARVDSVEQELTDTQRARDAALERIRKLQQCHAQLQATIERHTSDLVTELEVVQSDLDAERTRCTLLLANEKVLLRDLSDRNAALAKLQQPLEVVSDAAVSPMTQQHAQRRRRPQQRHEQQQQQQQASNAFDAYYESSATATTTTTMNSSRVVTPPTPQHRRPLRSTTASLQLNDPRRPAGHEQRLSATQSQSAVAPAKELDDLLHNLERISDFSAQQQTQTQQLRY